MGNWVVPPPPGHALCLQKALSLISLLDQSLQRCRQGALSVSAFTSTSAAGGDYLSAHRPGSGDCPKVHALVPDVLRQEGRSPHSLGERLAQCSGSTNFG